MAWTRATDLKAQLQRLWDRGEVLASVVGGEPLFPRRLSLKGPTAAELADQFEAARQWVAELRALTQVRLVEQVVRHRLLGAQEIPQEAWVDTLDAAVAILGKHRALAQFGRLLDQTRQFQPLVVPWLQRRPLQALELTAEWPRLLAVVAWLRAHPRPGVYLRHVDAPGVHSKFIEQHRQLLGEWLDLALPPEHIDPTAPPGSQFARRYGFAEKPERLRLRFLDPAASFLPGDQGADLTLDAVHFARLQPRVQTVFITENEVNFLAFPPHPASLVLFGAGYGLGALGRAPWLHACRVLYWGDLDTHGFAILDELRAHCPHAESLLMDRATLLEFKALWEQEPKATARELTRLCAEERELYDDLRHNRLGERVRLEQERVGFAWVMRRLAALG
ncbi:MAG: hypothetical protein HY902_11900 [Deltaproteobacteria bacterium]|nr:hypothetical protein [Deltaproteobacteria bacterium]